MKIINCREKKKERRKGSKSKVGGEIRTNECEEESKEKNEQTNKQQQQQHTARS